MGKPLKLINHPVRERIPIVIAAIGPQNVALAAEIAEGWEPIFYLPERAAEVWGASLAQGTAKRDPSLGDLDVVVAAPLAITDDADTAVGLCDAIRPMLALYLGGMGAKGRNFYNNLARRYGVRGRGPGRPRPLSGGQEERRDRCGARRAAALDFADRARGLRLGPAGGPCLRCHHAERDPVAGSAAELVRLIERIRELAGDL